MHYTNTNNNIDRCIAYRCILSAKIREELTALTLSCCNLEVLLTFLLYQLHVELSMDDMKMLKRKNGEQSYKTLFCRKATICNFSRAREGEISLLRLLMFHL